MQIFDYPSIGESIHTATLANGLTISVIPKPGYTSSFALFATNYGGADRNFKLDGELISTPAGVAHFLEHKMFDMPEGDNALSVLAANGSQPNAFTSSAMTAYYFESTNSFYENLEILLKFVSTAYFTPESVQKEQGIIAQEIRMIEDNPDYVVYDELLRSLYAYNPMRDTVAGTVESIAQITDKTLYDCHKVFYSPSNMTLCVVGDVDPLRVETIAKEMITSGKTEKPERDYGEAEGVLPVRTRFSRCMEVSAPQFIIGAKEIPEKDGAAQLRQKMIGGLALHAMFSQSSPFYTRLYAQGLLSTDFSADMDYAAGTLSIMLGGESRDPEKVFQQVCLETEKVKNEGFDPYLWARAKKSAYGSKIRSLSSFAGLCISMAESNFAGYNPLDSFEVLDAVTAQQAQDFIAKALAPERLAMSVINPSGREDVGEDA